MDSNFGKSITRRVTFIVALTVGTGFLLATFYFIAFHASRLSDDPADWASFGSYLGGVLGPIVALGSLFGLALLIDLQKKTIEATREEMAVSNQHLANQHFSTAVFELMRTVAAIRQTIIWHPTNLFNSQVKEEYKSGDIAINAIFHPSFQILEESPNWSDAHSQALLDNIYRDFKLAHQAFGVYWNILKESMDEIAFRGQQVSEETMRHGIRLFLTSFNPREYCIFYLLHCLNKEWVRLDLLESSKLLDRTEDYIVDRLRACRTYSVANSISYSTSPNDSREIELTGRGMDKLKTNPPTHIEDEDKE